MLGLCSAVRLGFGNASCEERPCARLRNSTISVVIRKPDAFSFPNLLYFNIRAALRHLVLDLLAADMPLVPLLRHLPHLRTLDVTWKSYEIEDELFQSFTDDPEVPLHFKFNVFPLQPLVHWL
ncbi:hypothetical protein FB451DRAFT_1402694 [Mycena latifolia]|nr:hypothetical protein FB451DRAFT_1402694 [Mycena latifolia]